jgi:hypothetical protein
MSVNYGEDGLVILDDLTDEEKVQLKTQVGKYFAHQILLWGNTFKPTGETVFLGGLEPDDVAEGLSGFEDSLVWADKNIETINWVEVEGLILGVTGYALVPGKFNYPREYGEEFTICEVPYTGGPYEISPLFHLAQMACPFCEAEGCDICDDEGEWEFED